MDWKEMRMAEYQKSVEQSTKLFAKALDILESTKNRLDSFSLDEEIEKRDQLIAEMQEQPFRFHDKDLDTVREFQSFHDSMNDPTVKQRSHVISYEFTPHEVGIVATVKCSCGGRLFFYY